jgi:quinol monooxygenase YgiN
MYGMIARIVAQPGKRDDLVAILIPREGTMPGCLSYIVAHDPRNADAIYITEAWDSPEAHAGSLLLPEVQAAIARGRPLIASFESIAETTPIGGIGLGSEYDNP